MLLNTQLLAKIAVLGGGELGYQPNRKYHRARQPAAIFCPIFSIHVKFVSGAGAVGG